MTVPVGRVTLVGAGPGDPDLLTVRAVRRLADADLVLYDALSSPEARGLAPEARWLFVGKRAGRHSMAQDTINRLMIREAQRGRHIVRLKSGDPFVLGRGGEEAEALIKAGVPFEVVPGVTSSIAAPGLAGIPVTHRGLSTGFVVISGHAPSSYGPLFDSMAPDSVTVVVLMGLGERAAISDRLIKRGWSAQTPVAVLLGAATASAWKWIGTLAELGPMTFPEPAAPSPGYGLLPRSPGILVIGDVVKMAATLNSDHAVATNHT